MKEPGEPSGVDREGEPPLEPVYVEPFDEVPLPGGHLRSGFRVPWLLS